MYECFCKTLMCACISLFMHVCTYVCMCVDMCVCMYACMHVCMYVCMYVRALINIIVSGNGFFADYHFPFAGLSPSISRNMFESSSSSSSSSSTSSSSSSSSEVAGRGVCHSLQRTGILSRRLSRNFIASFALNLL